MEVAAGPAWTDVFRSQEAGGTADGSSARGLLLSLRADAAGDVEYRWIAAGEELDDETTEFPLLSPGESAPVIGSARPVFRLQARGVAGAVEVQLEEIQR
jgi:hypothetical protein